MVSSLSAAKALCEISGWTLTNLSIHKILYLAHMVYMGNNEGELLIEDSFEAWDYGPVLPLVYHKAKVFGHRRVRNIFHTAPSIDEDSDKYAFLKSAYESLGSLGGSKLISITHWPQGAWAKCYVSGYRNLPIPNEAIQEEYRLRMADE